MTNHTVMTKIDRATFPWILTALFANSRLSLPVETALPAT